ncbi:RdgB/HAM1 family non-canonical purine NTP pyrophosphatase [Lysobacter maris]|uniref:dITP/XTP pyrophosphatase n=1 Tax=Marilutibacter maris TaxID=1605891 RepID=A0A508B3E9_9GAMM|nr:RdgB/HAM1 family non-canonical purine NTP pyrophosphatase [Lysobacter maris]KAB8198295.1 RdgB/HAM1 family non-canonical purine NTP pyrophosphatase [Lysobacter maris]
MTSTASTATGPVSPRSRWVIASSNAGKLREFRELLGGDGGIEFVTQGELGVDDAEETGLSFVENALLKARHAARATGLPALGDDSGLCVDALGGAPGLYSARYAGGHGDAAANIDKLLTALAGMPESTRHAHFIAVIVLLQHAEDPQPLIAQGVWPGRILHAPHGDGGFGYDPVFQPHGHDCSAAQLDPVVKNRISHRGLALASLKRQLTNLYANP